MVKLRLDKVLLMNIQLKFSIKNFLPVLVQDKYIILEKLEIMKIIGGWIHETQLSKKKSCYCYRCPRD